MGLFTDMTEEPQSYPWIDGEASKQLPILCAQEEGQTLELHGTGGQRARVSLSSERILSTALQWTNLFVLLVESLFQGCQQRELALSRTSD
jgi:hypothetical protein